MKIGDRLHLWFITRPDNLWGFFQWFVPLWLLCAAFAIALSWMAGWP
jgi:hypothetical protein